MAVGPEAARRERQQSLRRPGGSSRWRRRASRMHGPP